MQKALVIVLIGVAVVVSTFGCTTSQENVAPTLRPFLQFPGQHQQCMTNPGRTGTADTSKHGGRRRISSSKMEGLNAIHTIWTRTETT